MYKPSTCKKFSALEEEAFQFAEEASRFTAKPCRKCTFRKMLWSSASFKVHSVYCVSILSLHIEFTNSVMMLMLCSIKDVIPLSLQIKLQEDWNLGCWCGKVTNQYDRYINWRAQNHNDKIQGLKCHHDIQKVDMKGDIPLILVCIPHPAFSTSSVPILF